MSIVNLARPEIRALHAYKAAEQVDDKHQVKPPFAGGNVGDVTDELPAGRLGRGGIPEQVR